MKKVSMNQVLVVGGIGLVGLWLWKRRSADAGVVDVTAPESEPSADNPIHGMTGGGTIRGVDQTNVYAGGGYAGGGILGMNRAGDVTENTVGSSFRRFGSPNPSMAPVRGTDLTAIYAAGRYEGGGLLGM